MYSYTELTNSYNIFTIIDNLHYSLALFFSQYAGFGCAFKYYMCIHNYTNATNFYNIFTIARSQFLIDQSKKKLKKKCYVHNIFHNNFVTNFMCQGILEG